ncbi:MAG TPA: hypothetical protein EYP60_07865 [bacterium (Candidatus Stahlbacteria)]|nr:hypothetical protein [Candidatus Stahlbacteria bacterium]
MSIRYPTLSLLVCLGFSQLLGAQSIVNSFPTPGDNARGLAWDDTHLWCADATTDRIYKLDASDGSIISWFSFNVSDNYGGLTWSLNNNIWVANGVYVYRVNPLTGDTISSFHCPGG